MAINDFKPFSVAGGANVISQADYEALAALSTGFISGVAKANEINKVLRQASFIAAALAQFVSDKGNVDVLDDGSVSGFVTKLTNAFAAQYLSRTNPFADIKSDGTIATALSNLRAVDANGGNYDGYFNFKQVGTLGVDRNQNYLVSADDTVTGGLVAWLQNQWHDNSVKWGAVRGAGADLQCAAVSINEALILKIFADGRITALDKLLATQEWANTQFPLKTSLGNASTKTVGTGANQIPDMNSFQSGANSFGTWMRLPSGIMVQFGLYPTSGPTGGITFPTPFTSAPSYSLSPTGISGIMAIASGSSLTGINDVRTFDAVGNMLTNGVLWIAIGR
ncbi:hypothetical protein WAS61_004681 [Citrobacter freundii]